MSRKSKACVNQAKRIGGNIDVNDVDNYADKTLNRSLDEFDIMEESYMDDQHCAVLPKVTLSYVFTE